MLLYETDRLQGLMYPYAQRAESGVQAPQVTGLPSPMVGGVNLTTASTTLYEARQGQVIDWLIQNLTAATYIYVLQYENQPAAQGLRVPPLGYMSKDNWSGDLIVASSLASNCRYSYVIHGYPWKRIGES